MHFGSTLHRQRRMRFISLGMLLTIPLLARRSEADIAWQYNVSGELFPGAANPLAIRFSGTLKTVGDLEDLATPNSFVLQSIDSFAVNGVSLTDRRYWIGAGGLPFASGIVGAVDWDGSFGTIDSAVSQTLSAGLYPPPLQSKRITLSMPGMNSTATGLIDTARAELGWELPVSTIDFLTLSAQFSPVPEPSSQWLCSLVPLIVMHATRRNRG